MATPRWRKPVQRRSQANSQEEDPKRCRLRNIKYLKMMVLGSGIEGGQRLPLFRGAKKRGVEELLGEAEIEKSWVALEPFGKSRAWAVS